MMPGKTEPSTGIAVIILAAGASRRMGRPKQLIELEGETMLRRCLRLAADVSRKVYVVLGAHAERIRRKVHLGQATVVVNEDWDSGMAGSVRAGLNAALEDDPALQGALFLVVDQPLLDRKVLAGMLRLFEKSKTPVIVAADYGDRLGVPALFSKDHFGQLLALAGDTGARQILLRNADTVQRVRFEKGSIDLDTPEDLEGFLGTRGNS